MTAPPYPTLHRLPQDVAIGGLYKQAAAFVQANRDASCAGLQRHFRIGYELALQLQKHLKDNGVLEGIEVLVEPEKVVIRAVELAHIPNHVLVELIAYDKLENQHLVATSAPMHQDAGKAIARLYDKADDIPPTFLSLKAVLGKAGRTAWATAIVSVTDTANIASLQACANIKAQGVDLSKIGQILIMITLTPESQFIDVIRTVLNTVRFQLQPNIRMATGIVIDDEPGVPGRVQLLATGL